MVYENPIMMAKENLIERIDTILKTELDFLLRLSPKELKILATSLEDLVGQEKKGINVGNASIQT